MRKIHKTAAVLGILALFLVIAMVAVACGGDEGTETTAAPTETTAAGESYTIGITQIVSHPALDATAQGFIDALAEAGYVEGENVTYDKQNAQGEMANATTIAQKFAGDQVDLILSIATPTSQAAVQATTEIPIVFAAVTDPVAAALVANVDAPEGNVTGVSDLLPVQPHLDLIMELVPDAKTIGLLYNAGETNSVTLVEQEKAAAAAMGLEVVEATAASSAEVLAAAQSLVGRVDAISVLTDNTVVSAFESVVQVCEENGIPLVAGDIDSVERGAVAAYAFDYYDHGWQAGEVAAQILGGTAIADIPVQYAQDLKLAINLAAAEAMGVTIPDALKSEADQTF
jgi:putative ABC transport system substrate-binding protein